MVELERIRQNRGGWEGGSEETAKLLPTYLSLDNHSKHLASSPGEKRRESC